MTQSHTDIRVHLVDDDKILLKALTQAFELDNIDVVSFDNPVSLLEQVHQGFSGVIVTDVRMPQLNGLELFAKVKEIDPEIPVIIMTGHADVPMVLKALRDGVFDFVSKPLDSDHLLASARRAMETRRLVIENRHLIDLATSASGGSELIGKTPLMERLRTTIHQVAKADVDVLIEGETGTGKELVAKLLHQSSGRTQQRFVSVNCAALPSETAHIELFGSAYDEQTRSRRERPGKFELSDNGSLFLDDIDNLPAPIQGQLLPVLEERRVILIGGDEPKDLNLRIIAASSNPLSNAVDDNTFRADLFYRLNTVRLHIPPLRDRKEDIPLLFAHFISEASAKFSKKIPKISTSARRRLSDYDWPGNVRELKNFADSIVLGIESTNGKSLSSNLSLPERVERFEANTICSVLEETKGDVRATVDALGIPRKTFYDKISRHEIDLKKYREQAHNI